MSTQAKARMPSAENPQAGSTTAQTMPTVPMEARGTPQVPPEMASRSPGTETKPSLKTTEFYIFLISVAGVLAASQLVGSNTAAGDVFRADRAWFMVTLLAIAYLVSRGLAKSGSSWRQARERGR